MNQRKVIFRDEDIVEFCRTTHDTNEIHDPVFMAKLGKRVIVPGMFALSRTASLSADFLKYNARSIKVLFSSLLSSGDFVNLCACPVKGSVSEIRLSAINGKDTLTSRHEYTRISAGDATFRSNSKGILHRLEVTGDQTGKFNRLLAVEDQDVSNFLFALAYASQALIRCISSPQTEVEKEIDSAIAKNSSVSPFYHTLEIKIPNPFPVFKPEGNLDYYIHFECEKPRKLYGAYVCCEHEGNQVFCSHYKLVGIADRIIRRMAKEIDN